MIMFYHNTYLAREHFIKAKRLIEQLRAANANVKRA